MKHSILTRGALIALCTIALTGCQTASHEKNGATDNGSTVPKPQQTSDTGSDIDSLVDSALAHGTVVEFTEDGCALSPVQDDGNGTLRAAAPEHMDETEKITIQYQKDCEVQVAFSDASTGETTFSPAAISDIKRQTSILVFGEKQDSGIITASKVIILRTVNATGTGSGD